MKAINISRCGAQQDFSRHGLPDSSRPNRMFVLPICPVSVFLKAALCSCTLQEFLYGAQLACPAAKLIALKKAANTSHTASSTAGCLRTTKNSESREYTSKYIHSCSSSLMSFSILRMETQENRLQVQSYLQRLCYINILKYTFRRHKNKNFTLKIYPSIKSKRERKINVATSCLHHTTFPSRMLLCLTRN